MCYSLHDFEIANMNCMKEQRWYYVAGRPAALHTFHRSGQTEPTHSDHLRTIKVRIHTNVHYIGPKPQQGLDIICLIHIMHRSMDVIQI